MDIDSLIEFGITKTEVKIYLEILKIGETVIGNVIKRTGLHRGTVYNSINNLIKKGFLSFVDKEGIRYYKISGEGIFETIIENKEKILLEEKNKIKNFFKKVNKNEKQENPNVEVFYGIDAFKTLFLEIYDECKKDNCEYLFQGRGGEMQDCVGEGFYKYTQQLKKKMKVKCRAILDKENVGHTYHKYVTGDLRYLSKIQSPVNFWIYKDVILMILFKTVPLTSIKIKSKILADSFRDYFENLWKISNK